MIDILTSGRWPPGKLEMDQPFYLRGRAIKLDGFLDRNELPSFLKEAVLKRRQFITSGITAAALGGLTALRRHGLLPDQIGDPIEDFCFGKGRI